MKMPTINSTNNEEIRNKLIDAYIRDNKTYREICADLGVNIKTLHKSLKKYNIPARKRGKRAKKNARNT